MTFGTRHPPTALQTGLEVYVFLDLCEGLEPTAAGHLAFIFRWLLQRLVQQQQSLLVLPQVRTYADLMQRACDIVIAQCYREQTTACIQDLAAIAVDLEKGVRLRMWFLRAQQLLQDLSMARRG
eukprot:s5843_g5.t1